MSVKSEQSLKWYQVNNGIIEPAYEVLTKKGDKMTKVTLRQARPNWFLPSVTSVNQIVASFQLKEYAKKEVARACIDFPYDRPDKSEENTDAYIAMMLAKSEEFAGFAAQRGKALHKDAEMFLTEGVEASDPVGQKIAHSIKDWLTKGGYTTFSCEECLGSVALGYAGTPDVYAAGPAVMPLILDLKTTDLTRFSKTFNSWARQLGAYRTLKGQDVFLWQVVADRNTGEVLFVQHEDEERWANAFSTLYEFWVLENNYDCRLRPVE